MTASNAGVAANATILQRQRAQLTVDPSLGRQRYGTDEFHTDYIRLEMRRG